MMGEVLDLATAAERCQARRARGARIVMTNGCFDLLHAGHVRLLRAARELGDALVVAVNDDLSVQSCKGDGRPLVPAAARVELVAALACVDYVTVFSGPTAEAAVELVRPDIYVKGGDYAGQPLPEARIVEGYGGSVLVLPLQPGFSTSALIESARAAAERARCRNAAVEEAA